MKIFNDHIKNLVGGWFVGDFEPTCFNTKNCEVAYKKHFKDEIYEPHFHKKATEINLLLNGEMSIQNNTFRSGDIFIIEPMEIADPIFYSDCELMVVKVPCVNNDKFTIPFGLNKIPNLGIKENDIDGPTEKRKVKQEFSENNHKVLKESVLSIRDKCNVVLEIGVDRNDIKSSTRTIIDNKKPDTIYLGVDILEKKYLETYKNCHTLKCSSSEYEYIISHIVKLSGSDKIDLIHIDGFHSINQILDDWRFVNNLSDHGIVLIHDIGCHRGPKKLLECLDPEIWQVNKFDENNPNDWGIATVKRK